MTQADCSLWEGPSVLTAQSWLPTKEHWKTPVQYMGTLMAHEYALEGSLALGMTTARRAQVLALLCAS